MNCWSTLVLIAGMSLTATGKTYAVITKPWAEVSGKNAVFVAAGYAVAPYQYFGGPMHQAFWSHYNEGVPPAKALFQARIDYLAGMPHGQIGALKRAIERKILKEYTCLGLGW